VVQEEQIIRATAEVTNERQTIRSVVTGVDEVQTITTTCDDVTAEVQTVTTSAVDKDEVQTFALTTDIVDEIQIVRTTATSVAEVQRVDVSVERVSEVQVLGVYFTGVETDSCTEGESCSNVENNIQGNFRLSFDISSCGDETNWCAVGINENHPEWGVDLDNLVDWQVCAGSNCQSSLLSVTSTEDQVEAAINDLTWDGHKFMLDREDVGVNVTRVGRTITASQAAGVYLVAYVFEFKGDHLRGDVPDVYVSSASGFTVNNAGFYADSLCGGNVGVYDTACMVSEVAGESVRFDDLTIGKVGALDVQCNDGVCDSVTLVKGNQQVATSS